jgi:uncharacterized repeat protein (TIGR01451 family)
MYRVTLKDEKAGKIVTKANASSKNLPPLKLSLNTKIVASSINLSVVLEMPKVAPLNGDVDFVVKVKNLGSNMATNVTVNISIPKEFVIQSYKSTNGNFRKGVWKIPYIDSSGDTTLTLRLKSSKRGEFVVKVDSSSDDKDLNPSDNSKSQKIRIGDVIVNNAQRVLKVNTVQTTLNGIESNIDSSERSEKRVEIIDRESVGLDDYNRSRGGETPYKNVSPMAKDDEFMLPIGKTLLPDISKGVLINDEDMDGDALKVVKFEIDSNGDGIYESYKPKDRVDIDGIGSFMMLSDGSFEFEPINGYDGYVPAILYTISDSNGGESSARLILSIQDVDSVVSSTGESSIVSSSGSYSDYSNGDSEDLDDSGGSSGGVGSTLYFILYFIITLYIFKERMFFVRVES